MVSEHTPGPWQVAYQLGPSEGDVETLIVGSDETVVAQVVYNGLPTTNANAELIAKASQLKEQRDDLLAACEALIGDRDMYAGPRHTGTVPCVLSAWEQAEAAIAKVAAEADNEF